VHRPRFVLFILFLCLSVTACTRSFHAPLTNRTTRGVLVGAASGAAIGSVTAVGVPVGAAFGGVAGSILGFKANGRVTDAERLNEILAQENIKIIQIGDTFRIVIPSQKLFVTKTPRQLPTSGKIYTLVAKFMKQYDLISVRVEGFTDDRGSKFRNEGLSREWARTVMDQLVMRDINARLVVTEGYGEKFPIVDNAKQSRRNLNNRLEVRFRRVVKPVAGV
jgi:outer membrane protein OmpA-like peptidoglycan-associated protein